jgi:cholesterol transport system auxiliary component
MKNWHSALLSFVLCITACSPVKIPVIQQYQLNAFSTKLLRHKPTTSSLYVSPVEAAGGYQTEKMLYIDKTFGLHPFTKNAWVDSPGDMLYPLLVESLQKSGYFKAIVSKVYAEYFDYRLDTYLLKLQQNFTKKPSQLELSVKVVVTDVKHNKPLRSRIIHVKALCPMNTPYGGVIAANKATLALTAQITDFVIRTITENRS